MITWADINFPPINLWNFPYQSKDVTISELLKGKSYSSNKVGESLPYFTTDNKENINEDV